MAKTLTVYLAADVSKLTRQLNSARGDLNGFAGGLEGLGRSLSGMLGPALIGATAAAGAFAVKLAVDGVQAAMQEETELAKLHTTLKNMGWEGATDQVDKFIDNLQFATGVSDSELRPAMDRLLRSTGSVAEAQRALRLAVDASIGANKSLQAVADGLGKAYDGNTGALGRLGIGIDAATLKAGDLNVITQKMAETFGGQASRNAQTLKGRMDILQIAADELVEAFGIGLVGAADTSAASMDRAAQSMRNAQPAAQRLGGLLNQVALGSLEIADNFIALGTAIGKGRWDMVWKSLSAGQDEIAAINREIYSLGLQFEYVQYAAYNAAGSMAEYVGAARAGIAPQRLSAEHAFRLSEVINTYGDGVERATDATRRSAGASSGLTAAEEKLRKEKERLNQRFDDQVSKVRSLVSELNAATRSVEDWNNQITSYVNGLADNITSGIDLGQAFLAQWDDAGNATGKTLLEAFSDQIAKADFFGSVLQDIKRQGADQQLIEDIASLGPDVGGRLGQQMIRQGLVPEISRRLVEVRNAARTAAGAMVDPFLIEGKNAALATLAGLRGQLMTAEADLRALGQQIGKPIGASLKDEIVAALEAAFAAANQRMPGASSSGAGGGGSDAPAPEARPLGGYTPSAPGAGPNIPSGEGRIYAEMVAAAPTAQQAATAAAQAIYQADKRRGYTTAELYRMGVLH